MTTMELILIIVNFLSLGLAIYTIVRTRIRKAQERANIEVIREKLTGLHQELAALFHSVDGIVQIPKARDVGVEELQDIARIIRGNIGVILQGIRKYRNKLSNWKFGVMLGSDLQDDLLISSPEDKGMIETKEE